MKYKICPITYEALKEGEKYSQKGLRMLSPKLDYLNDLPFSAEQQRREAIIRAGKMSIQGVQHKFSANLDIKKQTFEICDMGGKYIFKPQSTMYLELPENEDLSMRLAADIIEVPLHGLIYSVDGSLSYFVRRFDRITRNEKLALEDFSQLAGLTRETKYDYSMEKLIPIIEKHCTFPALEKAKLFTRTVFNFLIGNEDMHLKNFSLISRNGKIELSPAYDFLNTTIALKNAKEEVALPLRGKKRNLNKKDIVDYYGMEKLGLNKAVIHDILGQFKTNVPRWEKLIKISFLSEESKREYWQIVCERKNVLELEK